MTTTPLQSNLKLGAYPTAASCARLHAKSVAWEWGLSELAETVELVVSELTTNGVKAAAALHDPEDGLGVPYVWVRLTPGQHQVLVEVWDSNPEPPIRADPDLTAESGRGLLLVEAVSATWGYYHVTEDSHDGTPGPDGERQPTGKVVWALVASTPSRRSGRHAGPSPGSDATPSQGPGS
jgi:anti-sigma regulatory factor (Ser/Thr protein kinase)